MNLALQGLRCIGVSPGSPIFTILPLVLVTLFFYICFAFYFSNYSAARFCFYILNLMNSIDNPPLILCFIHCTRSYFRNMIHFVFQWTLILCSFGCTHYFSSQWNSARSCCIQQHYSALNEILTFYLPNRSVFYGKFRTLKLNQAGLHWPTVIELAPQFDSYFKINFEQNLLGIFQNS